MVGYQLSLKPYKLIQTRGMKISKEQAVEAAASGAKYIYRYIWKTEPVTPNMAATNLLSTQQRIVKPTSPDFYRELEQGEFGAYVDYLTFCRKAQSYAEIVPLPKFPHQEIR